MKTAQRTTAKMKAYMILKNLIIDGKLKPGEFLNEVELSKNMGVSRTPLREALGKLEHDNFITVFPGKGCFVKQITLKDINNLYDLREELESFSIKLASENIIHNKTAIDTLRNFIKEFENNVNSAEIDPKTQFYLNKDFHKFIAESSMNQYLVQMLNILDGMDSLIRLPLSTYRNQSKEMAKEHLELAKALAESLEGHGIDKGIDLMRRHIRASKKDAIHVLIGETKDRTN
jgi:DNA-binding GntR family transcriptional regulator